jgi:hypothetical protein
MTARIWLILEQTIAKLLKIVRNRDKLMQSELESGAPVDCQIGTVLN